MLIRGYLLSIDEGSADKRFVVGFGSGASDLKAAVEAALPVSLKTSSTK
ncbi:MAG: DUF4410 domain-containing protein [Deltaproteobacteria bacterium]|nr:DUF4410 domain-containing protein [Deltaproteobacteria bacterium]